MQTRGAKGWNRSTWQAAARRGRRPAIAALTPCDPRLCCFGTLTAKPKYFVFSRHAKSKSHGEAVIKLLGKDAPLHAPSPGAFERVLNACREGRGRAANGVEGVGKRKKVLGVACTCACSSFYVVL